MSAQHTPGPWTRHDIGSMCGSVWADGHAPHLNTLIANVVGPDVKTAEANARLIAAAPDLLAACQSTFAAFVEHESGDLNDIPASTVIAMLGAAIAKAQGGAA